jgi:hypothetical protein
MADTGVKSPGTAANKEEGGLNWVNPNNIKVSDTNYATLTLVGQYGNDLVGSNFGFSVPVGATILGILLEAQCKCNSGSYNYQFIISNASLTTVATKNATITTTEGYVSLGGSNDLWGKTWTVSDINNIGFLAGLTTDGVTQTRTYSVNHLRVTVFYTPPVSNRKIRGSGITR